MRIHKLIVTGYAARMGYNYLAESLFRESLLNWLESYYFRARRRIATAAAWWA